VRELYHRVGLEVSGVSLLSSTKVQLRSTLFERDGRRNGAVRHPKIEV